ncbi:uncharacterized protein LOC110681596 [Chenopodium quinoa]|uniref:uncharacterized protein LOC110681596 n=1 Tax=Chenopodium quinoa TaxID=63459 RepID=UPI000B78AAEB|nr:uncharacterized protein LOC110681596 [Chenopodium quinoa]
MDKLTEEYTGGDVENERVVKRKGNDFHIMTVAEERLDKFVATDEWIDLYPCSKVEHLPRRRSDHVPLKITIQAQLLVNRGRRNRRRSFKIEKEWLRDDECGNIISDAWNLDPSCDAKQKIAACSSKLRSCSSKKSTYFKKEISSHRDLMAALMNLPPTERNIAEMRKIDSELDELEGREEAYWAQRSRQDWLREGDKNTNFFHKKEK